MSAGVPRRLPKRYSTVHLRGLPWHRLQSVGSAQDRLAIGAHLSCTKLPECSQSIPYCPQGPANRAYPEQCQMTSMPWRRSLAQSRNPLAQSRYCQTCTVHVHFHFHFHLFVSKSRKGSQRLARVGAFCGFLLRGFCYSCCGALQRIQSMNAAVFTMNKALDTDSGDSVTIYSASRCSVLAAMAGMVDEEACYDDTLRLRKHAGWSVWAVDGWWMVRATAATAMHHDVDGHN
jgi:hypothetical protein